MKRIAVTLTTINLPTLIKDFASLCEKRELTNVDFIVIGDTKTPAETSEFLSKVAALHNASIEYFDIERQANTFSKFTDLWEHIPTGSFGRRNYGDLFAAMLDYDVVIRIDDDNFPHDQDFFEKHSVVGSREYLSEVSETSGWFNVCQTLKEKDSVAFYPRGFPFEKRWIESTTSVSKVERRVAVNAGLWLGDPDVDAITRLCRPVDATEFDSSVFGGQYALAKGTWCPINTQNTAYAMDCMPAMFVSPFAGRYDDIISGYFLRAVLDHLGDAVTYGSPLLNQVRNPHNFWVDLDNERVGGEYIGELTSLLKTTEMKGTNVRSCFAELVQAAKTNFDAAPDFFKPIFDGMEIWAEVFERRLD